MAFDEDEFCAYKKEFKELGLHMPQLVYWQAKTRSTVRLTHKRHELGIQIVNGSGQKILNNIVSNPNNQKSYDSMIEVLSRHSEVDSFET